MNSQKIKFVDVTGDIKEIKQKKIIYINECMKSHTELQQNNIKRFTINLFLETLKFSSNLNILRNVIKNPFCVSLHRIKQSIEKYHSQTKIIKNIYYILKKH
ncbi:hypothetical protein ABPG72_017814 [Tetrahymena utriculariae]